MLWSDLYVSSSRSRAVTLYLSLCLETVGLFLVLHPIILVKFPPPHLSIILMSCRASRESVKPPQKITDEKPKLISIRVEVVVPSLHHSLRVCEGFLRVLQVPVGLLVESKLSVGVNVSVSGCLSLCVSLVMNEPLIQAELRRRPVSAGTSSSPP